MSDDTQKKKKKKNRLNAFVFEYRKLGLNVQYNPDLVACQDTVKCQQKAMILMDQAVRISLFVS